MAHEIELLRRIRNIEREISPLRVMERASPVGGAGSDIPAITLADAPAIGAAPTTIRSDSTIQAFADGGGSIMAEPSLLAGGGAANYISIWDGQTMNPVGSGTDGDVFCCAYSTAEDAYYIGGSFATVNGVACANIARIDCATFTATPLGAGVDNTVLAIALDEVNGMVHVGGDFLNAGGGGAVRVATYNIGAGTWAAWGVGCNGSVHTLALDAAGNRIFVGGVFHTAGGAAAMHIAEYAFGGGGVWSEPGGGLDDDVHTLVWESVGGLLYIGGTFAVTALHVATWDGANFAQVGDGLDDTVFVLAWDAGGGLLYAGGAFIQDGTATIDLFRLAVWDGAAWSDGGGILGQDAQVNALCLTGGDLYVGGQFYQHGFLATHPLNRLCRYVGGTVPLEMGSGANNTVYEMCADAAGRVLVVGIFTIAGGENLPGYINYAARRDHVHGMPGIATQTSSGFFSYLDKTKLDSFALPLAPTRGDIITAQGGPPATWQRLAIDDAGLSIASDGTDIVWRGYGPLNGFVSRAGSGLTMAGANLRISPTGVSYDIYTNGLQITKGVAEDFAIANDLTEHYAYFDTAGAPQVNLLPWDITSDNVPVATVYRDGAAYAIRDERHGYRRNRNWHEWAHDTIGCRYESGLGGTFLDTTFSINQGVTFDEDLEHDTGGVLTACRLWYRNAAGTAMRFESAITRPWKISATPAIQYDTGAGLADLTPNWYVCSWIYATNDITYPIYIVVGQAEYSSVAAARNDPLPAIPGQLTREWKLLYRAIYRRNGASATYTEATDYRTVSSGPGSSYTPASHTALTDRNAANQHPPAAIDVGTAQYQYIVTGAAPFTPAWSAGFLNITAAKTLTCQNSLTFSGTDAKALTLTGSLTIGADTSITGGGTVSLGGFTLTVPATGAAALLATANLFTAIQTITSTTTPQLKVRYDTNNRLDLSVSSAGDVTFDAVGALAPKLLFSDPVIITSTTAAQVSFRYDSSNKLDFSISGAGAVTMAPTTSLSITKVTTINEGLNVGSPAATAGTGDVSYSAQLEATRGGVAYTGYIYVPLGASPTTVYNGTTFSTVGASTEITAATLGTPGTAKAVNIQIEVKDSGGVGHYFACGPSSAVWYLGVAAANVTNVYIYNNCVVDTDSNGSIWYRTSASGANTLTVYLRVLGYWI